MILSLIKRNNWLYRSLFNIRAIAYSLLGIAVGKKGSKDHFLSTISFMRSFAHVKGMPVSVSIEPVNYCNLKCPSCETGNGTLGRARSVMSLQNFKSIIDKIASHTNTLIFYFMGEPFLNNDSYEMIRYAKYKKIPFVTACTNGEYIDPEKLVESGIDEVNFQLGGLSQESHRVYRVGGDLTKLIDNLKAVVKSKKKYKSRISIVCGFIVMKHNEHELGKLEKFKSDLGVDSISIINPCVRDIEQANDFLPNDERFWIYEKRHYEEHNELKPKHRLSGGCPWIYYSMVILTNGDVVPCCRDARGEYVMGNILQDDLKDIWNNYKFIIFRQSLQKDDTMPSICRLCSGFGLAMTR